MPDPQARAELNTLQAQADSLDYRLGTIERSLLTLGLRQSDNVDDPPVTPFPSDYNTQIKLGLQEDGTYEVLLDKTGITIVGDVTIDSKGITIEAVDAGSLQDANYIKWTTVDDSWVSMSYGYTTADAGGTYPWHYIAVNPLQNLDAGTLILEAWPESGSTVISGIRLAAGTSIGHVYVNFRNENVDFHVQGDSVNNLIFADASAGQVGILTGSPGAVLDVRGDAIFNEDGGDYDFRVEGDTITHLLFVNAGLDAVGINTTTPQATMEVTTTSNSSLTFFVDGTRTGGAVARIDNDDQNGDGFFMYLGDGTNALTTTNDFIIFQDLGFGLQGSIDSDGAGGIRYNTTSDRRLKQNIELFEGGLVVLDEIQIRSYEMKTSPEKRQVGVIAQELANVWPQAVTYPKKKIDDDGGEYETPWMVDYTKMVPLLISAVQELSGKIKELERRL